MTTWTEQTEPSSTYSEIGYFRKKYGDKPILNGTVKYGGELTESTYTQDSVPSTTWSSQTTPITTWTES